MRKFKKLFAVALATLTLTLALTGCSSPKDEREDDWDFRTYTGTDSSAQTIIVNVKILDDTDGTMFDGQAQIKKVKNPTVFEATEAAAFAVPYTFENDDFTSFGDISPSDTLDWYLYVNGEKVDKLPKDIAIKADDLIEWKLSPKA